MGCSGVNTASLYCGLVTCSGFFFFFSSFFCVITCSLLCKISSMCSPGGKNLVCPCPFQVSSCLAAVLQPSSGSAWDRAELYQLSSEVLISPMDLNKIKIASSCINPLLCWRGCSSSHALLEPGAGAAGGALVQPGGGGDGASRIRG